MRRDIFRDLLIELTLMPERWRVHYIELCRWRAYRPDEQRQYYGIEVETGWIFGQVHNQTTGHKWRLSFRQNQAFRKIIRSILSQNQFAYDEATATEIHLKTHRIGVECSVDPSSAESQYCTWHKSWNCAVKEAARKGKK